MKPRAKKTPPIASPLFGLLSRREAAAHIASGTQWLVSSALGQNDPIARATSEALRHGNTPTFAWEKRATEIETTELKTSKERFGIIRRIVEDARITGQRELKERTTIVLEELLTNALFHSFQTGSGKEKYARAETATLDSDERITVTFGYHPEGLYLKVADNGGQHAFEHIASSLERCFAKGSNQIESKENGAGLGLYMIFEAVTHWKILSVPGKLTEVSCWIAAKKHFDPDYLSFHFFQRESL